jgi:UDP-N-acetylmuramoyl-L-alanyl-D-glutamate--2,6-diaminopimelate ligase
MKIGDLFERDAQCSAGLRRQAVHGLQYDSRAIAGGDVFFAFPGEHVDGHDFVDAVLGAGAAAVASEREAPDQHREQWIQISHGRKALAHAALRFYERPDQRLKLTGVTGTNGKTSTVFLLDSILEHSGRPTARFGTIEHKIGQRRIKAVNTTPESLDLVRFLAELVEGGGTHATFEASSHALDLGRIHGFDFHTVVFTNLSQDHLDYHETLEAYAAAKRLLLRGAGGETPRFTVINRDDPVGLDWIEASASETLSYGVQPGADVAAENVDVRLSGLRFRAKTPQGDLDVRSSLGGEFNVANLLAAIAAALTLGVDLDAIGAGLEKCQAIPGRFELIDEGQPFTVIVDYAHTDDALRNLLESAQALRRQSKTPGRILTVFGCGGDRDRTKRPAMGEIAGRLSNLVILTSDNPRSEDPLNIINDIRVGLGRVDSSYEVEPDRAQAIRFAVAQAVGGDVVLIAGKGHETTQTIGGQVNPFDDREVARGVLRDLGYGADLGTG